MPVVFESLARVISRYLRFVVVAAILMVVAAPVAFVAGIPQFGMHVLQGAMFAWGLAMLSVWYHPRTGLRAKGQPRWKRMLAWPGAVALDLWFAICVSSFLRLGPLSVLP